MALEDPKRFRIELTFSRGADLSPLEVMIYSLFGWPKKTYRMVDFNSLHSPLKYLVYQKRVKFNSLSLGLRVAFNEWF